MPTTKNTQQNKASTVKKAPTSNQQTKSSTPKSNNECKCKINDNELELFE